MTAHIPSTPAKYICKSMLRSRYGLTDKWITRLGAPDKVMTNPNYRTASPSSLYSAERVEAYLNAHRDEYETMLAKLGPRREAAAAKRAAKTEAAERQREGLVEWARTARVEWHEPEWGCELDTFGLPSWATDRMIQARLRHTCTNYETLLARMDSLTDCSAHQDIHAYVSAHRRAYEIIKRRVNQRVEQAMGLLSWEPDRTVWV